MIELAMLLLSHGALAQSPSATVAANNTVVTTNIAIPAPVQGMCYKKNRPVPTTTVPPKPKATTAPSQPSTPKTPQPQQQPGVSAFAQSCLDAHNRHRAAQGVPPLTWNSGSLLDHAVNWAITMFDENSMFHSQTPGMGENIAMGSGMSCDEAVNMWMGEQAYWDGGPVTESNFGTIGHFSQTMKWTLALLFIQASLAANSAAPSPTVSTPTNGGNSTIATVTSPAAPNLQGMCYKKNRKTTTTTTVKPTTTVDKKPKPTQEPVKPPSPPKAPSPPPPPPSSGNACVDQHNYYRAQRGVGGLVWNSNLAASAQNWANYLASAGILQHSGGNYGENIHEGGTDCPTAVTSWMGEQNAWFNNPARVVELTTYTEYGHYTQVMWRGTSQVGCGSASGAGSYVVCQYLEPASQKGIPPLVWNDDLAAEAQRWANFLASEGKLEDSDLAYGENISRGTSCPCVVNY
ncbi:hypothetical protein HDV06_005177 [Boothiomyces sp. JEL0866]|nr:hypothetical protein HDV06_005177 [Boothiomyces sp. JEL0866]